MDVTFKRKPFNGSYVHVYETPGMIMGFTEMDFSEEDLTPWFKPFRWVELEQIHADDIYLSSEIYPGMEGDGIILDQKDMAAVIKTADCTPLFFWNDDYSYGGVLHIGWRGLLKGIEQKLLRLLPKHPVPVDPRRLNFYLGPAIEQTCYPVNRDLYEAFAGKSYRDFIFSPAAQFGHPGDGKYLLDVPGGIRFSLREVGIPDNRVSASSFCTFCEAERFPSYRRKPNTGKRIYNFLMLVST